MVRWIYLSVLFCTAADAAEDTIVLYNMSCKTLYLLPCYVKNSVEQPLPAGDVCILAPCSRRTIARPPRKFHWYGMYDRCLYVTTDDQAGLEQVAIAGATLIPIGSMQGVEFFIDNRYGQLQGYTALTWNIRMLHEALQAVLYYLMHEVEQEHGVHPYHTMQASLRTDTGLAAQESAYLQARKYATEQAGSKIISDAGAAWPRIAFCMSGGGYRAMISTLGWLQGAEKLGLLDATTYMATLSGSTWALAGFLQSGLSMTEHLAICIEHIEKSFLYDHDSDQVAEALLKQFVFTQQVSLIDFYGALLAQKILKPYAHNPHEIDLTSQIEKIEHGKQIFPLYTAVLAVDQQPYEWVEFSPYEVRSSYLGAAIPTWAFGRTFTDGVSTNFAPSQSLGFYMGMWGSALSANLKDLVQRYAERLGPDLVARILQTLVQSISLAEGRITAAQVPNWTFGTALPHAEEAVVQLLDAGLDCNLPLAPLLDPQRSLEIIIVFDATAYTGIIGSELLRAQAYAQRHGLPFPPIDYTLLQQPCSVHADWGNPDLPVILYVPLRKHATYQQGWDPYQQNFTSTFNFRYTKEQMILLSGLAEHSLFVNQQIIFDTIERVIARKREVQVN